MIPIDLTHRVALITGAATGLGRATATMLHQAGATVIVNYFDDPAGASCKQVESLLAELGERAFAHAADVRDSGAVNAMFDAVVQQHGALHIVVNNAGILRDRTIARMSDDEWQAVIDTNLSGVFYVCRAAARKLSGGGRLINIASISAALGMYGQGNYVAAKSGVIGLTRTLARELARRNILVNAIAPGLIDTDMARTIPDAYRQDMLKQIPLGRIGEPSELAAAVLMLASDLSGYITGQTLHVNGGWWMA